MSKKPIKYGRGVVGPDVALTRAEKIFYPCAEGGNQICQLFLSAFFMYYCTGIVGINPATVGVMIAIARIWDAINDPMMGAIVDRTNTRFGRCRPYLLFLALPMCAFTIMMFAFPQNLNYTWKVVWMYIAYIGQNMAYTAIAIPNTSLMPKMTQDRDVRLKLNRNRVTGSYLAVLFTSFLAPLLMGKFANAAYGMGKPGLMYTWTVCLFMIVPLALYLITFFVVKERQFPVVKSQDKKDTLGDCTKALVKNKYWVLVAILTFVGYTISGINSNIALYYTNHVLQTTTLATSVTLMLAAGPPLIMMIIIPRLAFKLGKRNATLLGIGISLVGLLLRLLTRDSSMGIYFSGLFLFNFGYAAFSVTLGGFMMDAMDYSEWKFGIRNESMIISANSLGIKAGTGIASAVVGFILSANNYNAATANADLHIQGVITNIALILPLILLVVFGLVTLLLDYDKKYLKRVEADLLPRRAALARELEQQLKEEAAAKQQN